MHKYSILHKCTYRNNGQESIYPIRNFEGKSATTYCYPFWNWYIECQYILFSLNVMLIFFTNIIDESYIIPNDSYQYSWQNPAYCHGTIMFAKSFTTKMNYNKPWHEVINNKVGITA